MLPEVVEVVFYHQSHLSSPNNKTQQLKNAFNPNQKIQQYNIITTLITTSTNNTINCDDKNTNQCRSCNSKHGDKSQDILGRLYYESRVENIFMTDWSHHPGNTNTQCIYTARST